MTPVKARTGAVLSDTPGWARPSVTGPTARRSLPQQLWTPKRVYSDKLSGTSTRERRAGLAALLDYARPGDAIVVVGIDRLGRNAAEVMTTIRELRDREIVLRSLARESTSNATGRMVAGALASPWPSWNWSWAWNAEPQHARHAGHAAKLSDDPRRSMRPMPH